MTVRGGIHAAQVSSKIKSDSLEWWAAVLWNGGNHGSLAYLKCHCKE